MSSRSWVGSGIPGKLRKCHQWNVSKSRLGGRKLGFWCVLPCPGIDWHREESSWFTWRYPGFGVCACPWTWRSYVWGWNRVLCVLYGVVDILWVVAACILPWSESRLLCLLCVECLCIWKRWEFFNEVKKMLLARGWMKWVTQGERWSVGPSNPETISRGGQSGLWFLGSP